MRPKAVIFDLDGTLIDNEGVYDRAFCKVLKQRGISCEEVTHTPGIGVEENWIRMKESLNLKDDPKDLAQETQEFYLKNLDEVKIRSGVREVMYYLQGKGIKRILATSNTKDTGTKVVNSLGISHHFESLTFGDEVERKKPAPDLFLKAIQEGGLNPRNVIVVEDSAAGIEAAKNAKAVAVALKTDWFTQSQLHRADKIVKGFFELLDWLRKNQL